MRWIFGRSISIKTTLPSSTSFLIQLTPLISSDTELVLTPDKIVEAISEIKHDSAPGPDGIPAILLKRCATSLRVPIHLLWSESMPSGIIPSFYKTGFVSPLFKKGSRCEPSNYRPVALTSHIVKVIDPLSEGLVTPPLGVEKLSPRFNFFDMFSCITWLKLYVCRWLRVR